MNPNVKRNIVQVRLSDKELSLLNSVREMMHCDNNSMALREMITDGCHCNPNDGCWASRNCYGI